MPASSPFCNTPSQGEAPLPNGSRLSCGASAGGRKRPAVRYKVVGAQTYASFESRPRQLQALVRQAVTDGMEACESGPSAPRRLALAGSRRRLDIQRSRAKDLATMSTRQREPRVDVDSARTPLRGNRSRYARLRRRLPRDRLR